MKQRKGKVKMKRSAAAVIIALAAANAALAQTNETAVPKIPATARIAAVSNIAERIARAKSRQPIDRSELVKRIREAKGSTGPRKTLKERIEEIRAAYRSRKGAK